MLLKDKVAVITGAARGLGRAYAEAMAREGAAIVAGDVRDCADTVSAIRRSHGRALGVSLDVASFASCQALAKAAVREFGRVDALINNAALYANLKGGRFDQLDEAQWDRVMQVNVKGVWNCCRAVVPLMRAQKSGSVINISSLAPLYGLPYALDYSVSKGAVIAMTRSLARELGRDWMGARPRRGRGEERAPSSASGSRRKADPRLRPGLRRSPTTKRTNRPEQLSTLPPKQVGTSGEKSRGAAGVFFF